MVNAYNDCNKKVERGYPAYFLHNPRVDKIFKRTVRLFWGNISCDSCFLNVAAGVYAKQAFIKLYRKKFSSHTRK